MKKLNFCLLISSVLLSLVFSTGCNQQKEEQVKKMIMATDANKPKTVDEWQLLAEKNPSFDNLTGAGLALLQAKLPEKALFLFERSLVASPKNAVALNNVCSTNNELGRWKVAIEACHQALAIDSQFQLAKNNLKFAEDQLAAQMKLVRGLQEKVDKSTGKVRRALILDLGYEYYKMADYEEAVSTWKKVPKVKDELYVKTLNNLGSAYILQKKFDLAQASLHEAGLLDPKNELVKNNLNWLKSASEGHR